MWICVVIPNPNSWGVGKMNCVPNQWDGGTSLVSGGGGSNRGGGNRGKIEKRWQGADESGTKTKKFFFHWHNSAVGNLISQSKIGEMWEIRINFVVSVRGPDPQLNCAKKRGKKRDPSQRVFAMNFKHPKIYGYQYHHHQRHPHTTGRVPRCTGSLGSGAPRASWGGPGAQCR